MANTYEAIATTSLTSSAADITFSSIPSTYTDLKVVASLRSDRSGQLDDVVIIKPNNSSSNLTYRFIRGSGSDVASSTVNRVYIPGPTSTASSFGNLEIYIPNYAGSAYKSFYCDSVHETNGTEAYMAMQAILWSDTTAITSLVLAPVFGTNFVQYSTATLYGIKNS